MAGKSARIRDYHASEQQPAAALKTMYIQTLADTKFHVRRPGIITRRLSTCNSEAGAIRELGTEPGDPASAVHTGSGRDAKVWLELD